MADIFPVITLYQPWATWIMRGWKTIETRTHIRFHLLSGSILLIHAGLTTDEKAVNNPYLTKEQIMLYPDEMINGYILGSAFVYSFRKLNDNDSQKALINCGNTVRYGLFLNDIKKFKEPIKVSGEIGIWYYDLDKKEKVRKPKTEFGLKLF